MKIKPLGFYVLIEMIEVEEVSEGGIIKPSDYVAKEQDATDVGYVRAIGPTAYVGYPGCELSEADYAHLKVHEHGSVKPHVKWGLEVGQKIEYRKFEGKKSAVAGYENFRYIPDSHIIGAIE